MTITLLILCALTIAALFFVADRIAIDELRREWDEWNG